MNWQEFLQQEAQAHGLSTEQEKTLLAALPSESKQLNQTQLARELHVEKPTIKRRLAGIYEAFAESCPELAEMDGAGKLTKLHKFLRQKYARMGNGETMQPPGNLPPYPDEFKSLIQEKIAKFCGRQFVFNAFKEFLQENPSGYFTLVGDAGMGKSAIAAKYVEQDKCPCYFNILVEGRNHRELFLKSIRQQLMTRYELTDAKEDDLPTLLEKVSQKIPPGERLVIVVDALDEVQQEPGGNLLNLPTTVPEQVYFLLTRRPYTLETKRLSVSPGVKMKELDLTEKNYVNLSRDDVKNYIRLCLSKDPEYRDGLIKWIEDRHIGAKDFVEQLADKSENNFMYLRYVVPTIADGDYDDLNLKQLPQGLLDYYQNHWVRMGMETAPQEKMVIILFIIKEIATPIPREMIAEIAGIENYEVQKTLEKWVEYLKRQELDGDICYSIYHASFLDFLELKKELDRERKLFQDVNQRIVEYLERRLLLSI